MDDANCGWMMLSVDGAECGCAECGCAECGWLVMSVGG